MEVVVISKNAFTQILQRLEDLETLYNQSPDQLVRDQLYTTEEVCGMLGVSRRTLQSYRDNGILGFIKTRNLIRYRHSDLEQFMIKNR